MAWLYISLLGSYQIELDGVPLSGFDSDKTRLLLAYLAVEAGKPHRRDRLVGLFWPEQPEASARRSLSQALYNLRQLLEKSSSPGETYILADSARVQFTPKSSDVVDVRLFNKLVTDCEKHAHRYLEACPECLERLEEANALYKGDFLADSPITGLIAFEEWVLMQREQLHRRALMMLTTLAQCFENRGQVQKALEVAHHQVELDPLWEAGQRRLMRLLALDGEYNQALAGYETYKRLLENELAVPPEKETQVLAEQIRSDARSEESHTLLPVAVTPLIGRRKELADLHCYLLDPTCRLLTILGPGGSGKTRLALEEARQQQYQFRDGVYFIPLSALGSTSSLMAVIAQGIGFTFGEIGDKKLQLLDYMRHKQVLLILDSFETVVESAGLMAEMLSVSHTSKVLVTSRVRLNLSGEQVYPLQGVEVPPQDSYLEVLSYPAAELFLEFAHRVNPLYQPEDLGGVAHICQLVEGMPLGLLLASSWVGDYPAREIAAQIAHKLDFLAVEWSDLPQRQRSLRATYEYSWNLLSIHEQEIMMKLSVFRNAFPAQAAERVAGASPQVLHVLVGKSLLSNTGEGKYQMHDLVRQYSAAKLAHAPDAYSRAVKQKHSEYFLEQVSEWGRLLKGPQQSDTLTHADKIIDDVQAAWEWGAQEHKLDQLSRSSEGILLFFELRLRPQEGEHACQVAIERIKKGPADGEHLNMEGWLLAWQASYSYLLGKVEIAKQLRIDSSKRLDLAEVFGKDVRSSKARLLRDSVYYGNTMVEQLDDLQQSAALYRELGDRWRQAGALIAAGEIAQSLWDPDISLKLLHEALALNRIVNEPNLLANNLRQLAWTYFIYGSWEIGAQIMKEAVDYYNIVGDLRSQAMAEVHFASSLTWLGRYSDACSMMEAALLKAHRWGYHYLIVIGSLMLGISQMSIRQYDKAFNTLQDAIKLAQQDKLFYFVLLIQVWMEGIFLIKENISENIDIFQQSVSNLRRIGAVGGLGTALGMLSLAQHRLGQDERAWSSLLEALYIAVKSHDRRSLCVLSPASIIMFADIGRYELVMETYSIAMTDPMVENSDMIADMVGECIELAKKNLCHEVYMEAESHGRRGNIFDVFGKLAQEIASWGVVPEQSQESVH